MSNKASKAEYVINCYIQHTVDVAFTIPADITTLVSAFYLDHFSFNNDQHGSFLEFPDNIIMPLSVRLARNAVRWSTCVWGVSIDSNMCNKFDICFKWIKVSKQICGTIAIGYFTSNIESSKCNFDEVLGIGHNAYNSRCIEVRTSSRALWVYEKNGCAQLNNYIIHDTNRIKQNDEFKLSFDFINDIFEIHHNEILAESLSLKGAKEITPAVSFMYQGETVRVTNWKLYD